MDDESHDQYDDLNSLEEHIQDTLDHYSDLDSKQESEPVDQYEYPKEIWFFIGVFVAVWLNAGYQIFNFDW